MNDYNDDEEVVVQDNEPEDSTNKNYFDSGIEEVKEIEKDTRTLEEKKKERLQIIILLNVLLIIGLFFVFKGIFNTKSKKKENIIEVQVEEDVPDGELEITSDIIKYIQNNFVFNANNPLYEKNILKLFDGKKVENYDFQTQMLLATSFKPFNDELSKIVNSNNYQTAKLKEKDLKKLLNKYLYNQNSNYNFESFDLLLDEEKKIYIKAVLTEGEYTFEKIEYTPSICKTYYKIEFGTKADFQISIRYKNVFTDGTKVYSDHKMSKSITTDVINSTKYINKGNEYEIIFYRYIDKNLKFQYKIQEISNRNYTIR